MPFQNNVTEHVDMTAECSEEKSLTKKHDCQKTFWDACKKYNHVIHETMFIQPQAVQVTTAT